MFPDTLVLHFSFLQKTGLCLPQCCCMEPFGQDLGGQGSYKPSAGSFQDQTTFQTLCTKHADVPPKTIFPFSRLWPPRTSRKREWRHTGLAIRGPFASTCGSGSGRDHSRVWHKTKNFLQGLVSSINLTTSWNATATLGDQALYFPLRCRRVQNVSRLVEKNRSYGGRIAKFSTASVHSHMGNGAEHLLMVFGLRRKWVWGKAIGEA